MGPSRVATISSIAVCVGGAAVALVHYYAGSGSPGRPEGWLSAIGFAAPIFGAGLVGLIGASRSHGALMLAAGTAIIPMSVVSIVLLPLLFPAIVLLAHGGNTAHGPKSFIFPTLILVVLVGAFALTVFHQDPAEWSGPDGPESSSNIVTNTEALFAIASAVGANVVATIVATKDRHRPKLTL